MIRRRARSLGAGVGLGGHTRVSVQLPAMETIPPEHVRRANLVGKPERIDPTLLLRPPAAVPCELDRARLSATLDRGKADEVGASRSGIDPNPLDHPFGVRVQELIDEAEHLDARDISHHGDRGRICARGECDDVRLEAFGGAAARQDLGVDWHGRNISAGSRPLGQAFPNEKTKLTDESAHAPRGAACQW